MSDNCGLTVAQEAELARRLESLRQPAHATDAEIEAAMWRYRDAAISVGSNGDGHGIMAEYGKAPSTIIAKAIAEVRAKLDATVREQIRLLTDDNVALRKERDEARAEVERLKAGGCSGDFKSVAEAMLARWLERRARCLNGVAPTLAEIQAAMPSWTNEVVAQESAPRGSAMRRTIDAADRIIDMLWKHSETLRERFDYEMEQRDELRAALVKTTDERDDARAELARLRAGGCARDQRTTQFCAEAVALQKRLQSASRELAIRELEELRTLAESASLSWPSAMPWIVARIDERLAKLREVRP